MQGLKETVHTCKYRVEGMLDIKSMAVTYSSLSMVNMYASSKVFILCTYVRT